MKLSDIPTSVLRPSNWQQWKVIAYRGKTGDIRLGQTFVRAHSEAEAVELGRKALKLTGIRGRFVANASPYYPWLDIALQGYVGYCG